MPDQHIRSEDNLADLCTKVMAGGQKRDRLVDMVLHYATGESTVSSVKTTMSVKMLERAKQAIDKGPGKEYIIAPRTDGLEG